VVRIVAITTLEPVEKLPAFAPALIALVNPRLVT
jgi:hypothetical protein